VPNKARSIRSSRNIIGSICLLEDNQPVGADKLLLEQNAALCFTGAPANNVARLPAQQLSPKKCVKLTSVA
jgi:hypothetical protein